MDTSFFVRREKIVAKRRSGIALPFKKLFILLSNLALDATEFFRIPVNRIVELGWSDRALDPARSRGCPTI